MDVTLLKESFNRVLAQKEKFVHQVYQRLFETSPDSAHFFAHTDMQRQEASLLATVTMVIMGIERKEQFVTALRKSGRRHHDLDIHPKYYPAMGAAILAALQTCDPQWNEALRETWAEAINSIVRTMMESYEPEATVPRLQVSGVRQKWKPAPRQ